MKYNIIGEYIKADRKITKLTSERDTQTTKIENKTSQIENRYNKQIGELKEKRDQEVSELTGQKNQIKEEVKKKVEELYRTIEKTHRIIALLKTDTTKDITINDENIHPRCGWCNDEYFEPLGYIFDDDFLKVKLYIASNDRPKNKYSLIAVGKTHFRKISVYGRNIQLYPRMDYYCSEINTDGYFDIEQSIKHLPNVDDLKEYLKTHRDMVLTIVKQNYDALKKEYLDVVKKYNLKDFDNLLEHVDEKQAPLICTIKRHDSKYDLRLYNGYYYQSMKERKENTNPAKYIKVNDKFFEQWCSKSILSITQTGNMMFSSWWSVDIEPSHQGKTNTIFSKKNYERIMKEATDYYNKHRSKTRGDAHDHFSYPEVTWHI